MVYKLYLNKDVKSSCGSYPETQVTITGQFISGLFEKQYACLQRDEKKQEIGLS